MGQTATIIPEKIFFKIGEVCDLVGVQAHVLRYWETEFPMLSPQKNKSGQRTYRRRDVEIALRIKDLLYEELYTIAGAKKRLQSEMRDGGRSKSAASKAQAEALKPGDQPRLIDEQVSDYADSDSVGTEKGAEIELNAEHQEALKSLVSQLLELREMLKTDQTLEAEKHISNSKQI